MRVRRARKRCEVGQRNDVSIFAVLFGPLSPHNGPVSKQSIERVGGGGLVGGHAGTDSTGPGGHECVPSDDGLIGGHSVS